MTATKDPSAKVVAEILAGRHDGSIGDIMQAIVKHLRTSSVRMCWRLRLDGDVWDEDTVTAGELMFAEKVLSTENRRVSYTQIDPKAYMDHRVVLVVAHLHKINGLKIEDAFTRAEAIPLSEQEQLLELYEVGDAPKDPETSPPS